MSPRRSAADARRTRDAIVDRAVTIGSTDGLASLSFGRVAEDLAVTKSGVVRHFPTKEDLQLAALAQGRRVFRRTVWDPVAGEPAGLARLQAAMESWLTYLGDCPLPGGCMLTAASNEFDSHPGAVRDAVRADDAQWSAVLVHDAEIAVRAGELPPGTDPVQVDFDLRAIALAVNQSVQLREDPQAVDRGRRAVRRVLGGG